MLDIRLTIQFFHKLFEVKKTLCCQTHLVPLTHQIQHEKLEHNTEKRQRTVLLNFHSVNKLLTFQIG